MNFSLSGMTMSEEALERRLRALPDFDPPAGGWQRLAARMQRQQRRRRAAYGGFALAASLLVTVGLLRFPGAAPEPAAEPILHAPAEVVALMDQSARLERQLHSANTRTVVWDASRAEYTRRLEDRLALIDLQLNYAAGADAEDLWRNRVALMNELVRINRGASPSYFQTASYQTARID